MTVADLFRSSLRMIPRGLRPGQTPGTSWTTDVLFVANAMLDAWSIDRFMVYQERRDTYPLVPNQQSYKIGIGAPDFNATRPVRIDRAAVLNVSAPLSPNEVPLKMLTDQEWALEPYKTGVIFSPIPTRLYNDRGNPISTLTLLPICNIANTLVLYSWQILTQFVNLTDVVVFPPGYADAVRYNLGVRLALEWGVEASALLIELARSSKANVASLNSSTDVMMVDPAIRSMNRPGWYDYISNVIR